MRVAGNERVRLLAAPQAMPVGICRTGRDAGFPRGDGRSRRFAQDDVRHAMRLLHHSLGAPHPSPISLSFVSFTNSVPITSVITAMITGYHSPE